MDFESRLSSADSSKRQSSGKQKANSDRYLGLGETAKPTFLEEPEPIPDSERTQHFCDVMSINECVSRLGQKT